METKPLPPSKVKLLAGIEELKQIGLASNADGLLALLKGTAEEEGLAELVCFGSLRSLKGKACKNRLLYLFHNGFVSRFYQAGDYYYSLTEKGREEAKQYLAKPHKKSPVPQKPIIQRYIPIQG